MTTLATIFETLFTSLNLYATFIFMLFGLFGYVFYKAQRNNKLDWVDIITKDGRIVSLTKILQLVGGVIATWVVVQVTIAGNLTWDILAIYLAYVASIEGFSKFIQAKYGPYGESANRGSNFGGFSEYQGDLQPPRAPAHINKEEQEIDLTDRLVAGGAKARLDD